MDTRNNMKDLFARSTIAPQIYKTGIAHPSLSYLAVMLVGWQNTPRTRCRHRHDETQGTTTMEGNIRGRFRHYSQQPQQVLSVDIHPANREHGHVSLDFAS